MVKETRYQNFGDDRQLAICVNCSQFHDGSKDHIPSKAFLDKPYPDNLRTLKICKECNASFSLHEEYVAAWLEFVACNTVELANLEREKIRASLSQKPALLNRITNLLSTSEIAPEIERTHWERVETVLRKNGTGHVLYELNESPKFFSEESRFRAGLLANMPEPRRRSFEQPVLATIYPEIGSRAFQRLATATEPFYEWIVVQPNRYRYMAGFENGHFVRIVVRETLAVEITW